MSRKQSFDLNLSMSSRLNYPQKLSNDSYTSKKYQTNFDKFSSQVLDRNVSQQTNYASNLRDFSGIRKLPENISSIRETFSFNPVSSARCETESNQTASRNKSSRLNELLNQAIDLKTIKRKQFPKSDQGILSSSLNIGPEIYSKSQTQISEKPYPTINDRKYSKYTTDKESKPYETSSKNNNFQKSYSASVQQEIRKIREENQQRKNNANTKQIDYEQSSPYLKNHSAVGDQKIKDSFSKKNYVEYYSPKLQKSSYSSTSYQFNTLSPPYQRRKKQTSFDNKCESPKVSLESKSLRSTLESTSGKDQKKQYIKKNDKIKIQDFQINKKLGQGRFGVAYLAFHKSTGGIFAIKIVKKQTIKSNKLVEQFILQVKLQTFLTHPFILKIYCIFDDQEYIYLVMQYLQQGTLFNYLKCAKSKKLTEIDAAQKIRYLAESIKYLQDRGIAHRDIKPQNIIMTNGVCKLADFGWATFCDEQRRKTYCGTCDYVAPEILQGQSYDESVDLWCIGVLAYELIAGKAPFYHMSQKQTRNKIINVIVNYPEQFSQQLKSFLSGLIQKNPDQRMSIEQILEHPFIKNVKLCA